MARTKIDYGIDLGTTNSAIARMESGKAVIKKTETLKDTMPSCISFDKKKAIIVGDKSYTQLDKDRRLAFRESSYTPNTFIEFKRTMGTDKKYYSAIMDKNFTSEELSAEVLKRLKSFVSDEEIRSIVVTVPAKFTINQTDATNRAAKLAGFRHCELLQEPIAASMAYGMDAKQKDGFWLVFDFGGGTFDAALLKVDDGIMKVHDTEGDNHLGGKNLDEALIDEMFIPYFEENYEIDNILGDTDKKKSFQDMWKAKAEEAKIQLSFTENCNVMTDLGETFGEDDNGEAFELDITISQSNLEQIFSPIFQKAVDILKDLLRRNNLKGSDLGAMILVGGPTYSPILRNMLKKQITEKIDTSVDPMTVVARGAALYASTINISEDIIEETRDKTKIQLGIGYEPTTVELEEFVTFKLLKDKIVGEIPDQMFVEVCRGDKAWTSAKVELNEKGNIIDVMLNEGQPNAFNILVYDNKGSLLPCEPNEFTILQGGKIGSAPLSYYFGIEIEDKSSGRNVFKLVKGLEKNTSTPATGVINGLKTQKQIRPGIKADFIKIPLYQGNHNAEGSRAIYNELVYEAIINGEDLPMLLPEGSEVDLTINIDRSGTITFQAFFPCLDFTCPIEVPYGTVQKEIDTNWLDLEIKNAKEALDEVKYSGHSVNDAEISTLENNLEYIEKRFESSREDVDRKKETLNALRDALNKIDKINESTEWPKLEAELRDEFEKLEKANKDLGNEKTRKIEDQLRQQVDQVIKAKNVNVGRAVLKDITGLYFLLTEVHHYIAWIRYWDDKFDSCHWKDRNRARKIIEQGLQIIGDNPSVENLEPLIDALFALLPPEEQSKAKDLLTNG